jgi:hypothetical protein
LGKTKPAEGSQSGLDEVPSAKTFAVSLESFRAHVERVGAIGSIGNLRHCGLIWRSSALLRDRMGGGSPKNIDSIDDL